ncbi:hypothetical protein BT96DRAFT_931745 [Gymnopus androsaceus JB14]|uniref:Uncharacterized protein n=1 Tax=Gymnopus androsaceus JB14 TaxID=1447944 RepID=A0A6A4IFY9_9AGAR|nr:hypothetical protein BT96DRAFT_931745 [Gymnopus androsaceus JB14]
MPVLQEFSLHYFEESDRDILSLGKNFEYVSTSLSTLILGDNSINPLMWTGLYIPNLTCLELRIRLFYDFHHEQLKKWEKIIQPRMQELLALLLRSGCTLQKLTLGKDVVAPIVLNFIASIPSITHLTFTTKSTPWTALLDDLVDCFTDNEHKWSIRVAPKLESLTIKTLAFRAIETFRECGWLDKVVHLAKRKKEMNMKEATPTVSILREFVVHGCFSKEQAADIREVAGKAFESVHVQFRVVESILATSWHPNQEYTGFFIPLSKDLWNGKTTKWPLLEEISGMRGIRSLPAPK